MSIFNKNKPKIEKVYIDNAGSFSCKENLGKELTFLIKVKSKTHALSNGGYYGFI
jgi:hypothetical protein